MADQSPVLSREELKALSNAYEARYAAVPEAAKRFAAEKWGETWSHAEMGSLLDFANLLHTAEGLREAEAFRKAALEAIQSLRHAAACNFTPEYSGAQGVARCDSFYEAYEAVRKLPAPGASSGEGTGAPASGTGYVRNCYVSARPGETLFDIDGGKFVVRLDGYCIVPKEHLSADEANGLCNGSMRVVPAPSGATPHPTDPKAESGEGAGELVLVPAEATGAMWEAGQEADVQPGDSYSAVYRAMVAARPPTPASTVPPSAGDAGLVAQFEELATIAQEEVNARDRDDLRDVGPRVHYSARAEAYREAARLARSSSTGAA